MINGVLLRRTTFLGALAGQLARSAAGEQHRNARGRA
jgi:hypothetical protein